MNVAVTGSNGFIGKELLQRLKEEGKTYSSIPRKLLYNSGKELENFLKSADVIVNLAGASIQKRWSRKHKFVIYHSRVYTTRNLINAIRRVDKRPKTLLSVSAIGIYDTIHEHDENSPYLSNDFLGKVCRDWEHVALDAKNYGLTVYIFRLGIVLGKNGGVIKKLFPFFNLGLGATIGKGNQAMSFIHIDDLLNVMLLAINNTIEEGIYNVVSPHYTTNEIFSKIFAKNLNRPLFLSIPSFALKMMYGEGALVLLSGQKVKPLHLIGQNIIFKYPTIEEAMNEIINKSQS